MDSFALLDLPRRPLLSEEEIGTAYRKLASSLHPDQAGGDAVAFRNLGEAAAILRDPARRLRELAGQGSGGNLPHQAAEHFLKVAEILGRTDTLLEKQSQATNALAKALLVAPLKALTTDLKSLLAEIRSWRSSLNQKLAAMDQHWPEHDPATLLLLADSFAYAGRWVDQLRERELTLDCLQ
jgi:curved DNA-binding protein CbpA